MPRITYIERRFSPGSKAMIDQANAICREYTAQGLSLTLRQLYYQFVARGLLPNRQSEYKRLGSVLNDARMAGLMDWDYLVDRTRNLASLPHWSSPEEIIDVVARQYRTERWNTQPTRVEVWIEKDAGIGVIEGVCQSNDVPFFSCRGYTSVSEIWAAGQRLRRYMRPRVGEERGQDVVILHIGDHDPSGIDMSRDIEERLRTFLKTDTALEAVDDVVSPALRRRRVDRLRDLPQEEKDALLAACHARTRQYGGLEVRRIALNYEQVLEYDPPPNPAKTTDARYEKYVRETGLDESWELDALDPSVLRDLIQSALDEIRDEERWAEATAAMERDRTLLTAASDRWSDVVDLLDVEGDE